MPGFHLVIIPVTAFAQNCTVLFDEELAKPWCSTRAASRGAFWMC